MPSTEIAPGLARRRVAVACEGWPHRAVEDALVLTSELVTNAVRYGDGALALAIAVTAGLLHVEVSDGNPDGVRMGTLPEPDSLSGRGLFIVAALSSDWGCRPRLDGVGKTVWFDLLVS